MFDDLQELLQALLHLNKLTGKEIIGTEDVAEHKKYIQAVTQDVPEYLNLVQKVQALSENESLDVVEHLLRELELKFTSLSWLYGRYEELLKLVQHNVTPHWSIVPRVDALVTRRDYSRIDMEIDGRSLITYSKYVPAQVKEQGRYPTLLSFDFDRDYEIQELSEPKKELIHIEEYAYVIRGQMLEDRIDAGIVLMDEEEIFPLFPHLIGKYVEFRVTCLIGHFLK
ncbi:MAG: hypothetical protein ACXVPK_04950 [Tumebacillaceae bacterium]